jgi:nicotinate-nucleotide adenylyltransferase
MKIAIFGGSFSPIHLGHIRLANHIVENNIVDKVLVMPCYKSLYNKSLVSGEHRLNMIELSKRNQNVLPFDWEIKNKIEGIGTYDIMKMLENEFKENELYFVIGLDNSQKVKSWKNGNIIVDNMKFIVVPRKGVEINDNWFTKSPHIFMYGYTEDSNSSTNVKQLLKENKDTSLCLDNQVKDYILKHNLYKEIL